MKDGLFLAWNGVQRNGIKSFGISGPDTIDLEVLLLQIPRLVCNQIQFKGLTRSPKFNKIPIRYILSCACAELLILSPAMCMSAMDSTLQFSQLHQEPPKS